MFRVYDTLQYTALFNVLQYAQMEERKNRGGNSCDKGSRMGFGEVPGQSKLASCRVRHQRFCCL